MRFAQFHEKWRYSGGSHISTSIRKILQAIGIIVIKSKGTRVVTYTSRYSIGHLITNSF